jgi:hypothetical protein
MLLRVPLLLLVDFIELLHVVLVQLIFVLHLLDLCLLSLNDPHVHVCLVRDQGVRLYLGALDAF